MMSDTPTYDQGTRTLTIEQSIFSIMAALIVEMLFMLFSIYNAV